MGGLNMYLTYKLSDGLVVKISSVEEIPAEGYSVAISDLWQEGDEFVYTIHITDVDDDGYVVYHNGVKNNPQAETLLRDNSLLKQQLEEQQNAIDDLNIMLADLIMINLNKE